MKRIIIFASINTMVLVWTLGLAGEQKSLTILNLHYKVPYHGGIESHLIMFNKIFAEHSIKNVILTSKNSRWLIDTINQTAQRYGPPCDVYHHDQFDPNRNDLEQACQKHRPSVIICNWMGHIEPSIQATQKYPARVILMNHHHKLIFNLDEITQFNLTNGIVSASPIVTKKLKVLQHAKVITVKKIEHIPPFWDEDRFLSFTPTQSKQEFFQKTFNLTITDNYPIICSIATLSWYKNHEVLLHAFKILHDIKKIKCHLMLAGEGPEAGYLKCLAKSLTLEDHVHFLGQTDAVPELLYHADLHVLPSAYETFGIAHLEAAMMKKPFIGATGTGADYFIRRGVTGFVFQNNNAHDLANTLEILLLNEKLRKYMGKMAYNFVRENYANNILFDKWMKFLEKI